MKIIFDFFKKSKIKSVFQNWNSASDENFLKSQWKLFVLTIEIWQIFIIILKSLIVDLILRNKNWFKSKFYYDHWIEIIGSNEIILKSQWKIFEISIIIWEMNIGAWGIIVIDWFSIIAASKANTKNIHDKYKIFINNT